MTNERSRREEETRGGREGRRDRGESEGRRGGRDRDEDRGSRSRGGSTFRYQARDPSELRRRAERSGGDYDKMMKDHIKMWKPNDKTNRIRILPPTWQGATHFGFDVYVHYGIGPDRQSYLDLAKMKGAADPITEEYNDLRRTASTEEEEKEAKDLSAKPRVVVYLIDRDNEKEGVQCWFMPAGLDKDIVMISEDKSTGEVLNIDDPEEGYDVIFEKNGKAMTTKYEGVTIARRSSPLGRDEWLEFANDNPIPDQLLYYDYDHIATIFNGGGAVKNDRDVGSGREVRDEGPARRSSRADSRDSGRARPERDEAERPGRGRDREETTSRRSRAPEEPTWDSIHSMTAPELDDLIDQEKLDINPREAKDDEDLADWICDELKLKKPSTHRAEPAADESASDRLKRMRQGRD